MSLTNDFLKTAREYLEYADDEIERLLTERNDCKEEAERMEREMQRGKDYLDDFKVEIGIDPSVSLSVSDIAVIKQAVQSVLSLEKVY